MVVAPGTEIAGMRVLTHLGSGAASQLYLVQDVKSKHVWTLKHIRKQTEKDQRFLDQADMEYTVGSQVRHPSIRRVERVIKNRRVLRVTEMYLVMEFVDGLSLDRHPPKSFLEAANIFEQVSGGLYAFHQQGYVHADMKPNNIIWTDEHLAKIIDLGQSCTIGTTKERIQGTIDYIAPEQVHRREITPATDTYNLGATMYWCLTGRHIPTAMSQRTGLGIARDTDSLALPTPPVELVANLPVSLSELIMEMVQPDPKKRPGMQDVHHRLQVIHIRLQARGVEGTRFELGSYEQDHDEDGNAAGTARRAQ